MSKSVLCRKCQLWTEPAMMRGDVCDGCAPADGAAGSRAGGTVATLSPPAMTEAGVAVLLDDYRSIISAAGVDAPAAVAARSRLDAGWRLLPIEAQARLANASNAARWRDQLGLAQHDGKWWLFKKQVPPEAPR